MPERREVVEGSKNRVTTIITPVGEIAGSPLTPEQLDRMEASALRNGVFGAGAVRIIADLRASRLGCERARAHVQAFVVAAECAGWDDLSPELAAARVFLEDHE